MAEYQDELAALRQEVAALREEVSRLRDRGEIENLMARYQHYLAAGLDNRILDELWSHGELEITHEHGASGVYAGLRKVGTYYHKKVKAGKLNVHTISTPCIEIAPDGKTASGLWHVIGTETDAGELGPNPPESFEERLLLTSQTAEGKRFRAEWIWQKLSVDFIKEDGSWKLLHVHDYEIFRCPFDENWVTYSTRRWETDGIAIDAMYTSSLPYRPDEPHENNADYPTTEHWQYAPDAIPVLCPEPPAAQGTDR